MTTMETRSVESIILGAIGIIKLDPSQAALEAIQTTGADAEPATRKQALDLVREAALHPEMGMGEHFQRAILDRALQAAMRLSKPKRSLEPTRSQLLARESGQRTPVSAGTERKNVMSESNNEKAGSNPRSKKYNVGDVHNTVATMGLQPTDANRKPTCGFQFSRKTGRDGVMDLPEGTEMRYVGARLVYDGNNSSKRMIGKVTAGTRVILNGQDSTLDSDIEIAFVVNHIDADDPYNVQARENETKRAEKARIKAAAKAAATKTQAA